MSESRSTSEAAQFNPVDLLGVHFHRCTEAEVVEHVCASLAEGRGGWIVTPNLDIVRLMSEDPRLARFLTEADLVVADGMPLVWASRLMGDPLPERVAGSSLIFSLCAAAARDVRTVFLLGGNEGTAEAAGSRLGALYPRLRIVGWHCPPLGFERSPEAIEGMRTLLRNTSPDLVFVALGCPKQERLIAQLRSAAASAWYVGVGISFSYVCGQVQRAPLWMRRSGLEWVHRLLQEPRRLARRYLRHDVPFALRLLGYALWSRVRRWMGAVSPSKALVRHRKRDG